MRVTAVGAPPLALLSGPSGDVDASSTILLDARDSFDPDTSGSGQDYLSFSWACR